MKNQLLTFLILALACGVASGQYMLDDFESTPADTNYWAWYENVVADDTTSSGGHYQISGAANADTGWIELTYVTSPVTSGSGALQIDYSVHNAESWGGYSKFEHWHPDSGSTYDFSAYDSISIKYYNSVPQSLADRVSLRMCLQDVSDSPNGDTTYTNEEAEYYYSFHYVLDSDPGWNEIKMPIEAGDYWGGEGFNLTGWAGITGNSTLDKDKIKGWTFEFSISGAGDRDFSEGQIVFDQMILTGSKNKLANSPGFEDGGDPDDNNLPIGWGVWQASWDGWGAQSHIVTQSGGANSGDYWLEMGADIGNAYAVAFQGVAGAQGGEEWEVGAYIKDVADNAPDTSFAALKLEAFSAGSKLGEWEDYMIGVTSDWKYFTTKHIMPAGTDSVNAVLVVSKWLNDGIAATYGFDDVVLLNNGLVDQDPPDCPTGMLVASNTDYFNIVSWVDVPDEEGETYTLYSSPNPITDLEAADVEVVSAGIGEGLLSAVHWLYYPLEDTNVDMYYAMTCTDNAANVSECFASTSTAAANLAKGIATASLNPPANFVADGDLSEWYSSDIMPFVIAPSTDYTVIGGFTDDNDLTATVYMAFDADYLYVAVDVVDDIYYFDTAGNWWDQDGFDFFFGLYDQRGAAHGGYARGANPDYKIYMTEEVLQLDNPTNTMIYDPDSANYHFESLGAADYVIETKVSLDQLAAKGEDARFTPTRGMKIPLELYFHDSDCPGDCAGGNLGISPYDTDLGWQSPSQWIYTWIGDTTHTVGIDESDDSPFVANEFQLSQNYPNPFNPVTNIDYTLGTASEVDVKIYNLLGAEIAHLVNNYQPAGKYSIVWNARNVPSGVYFYRLKADGFVDTKKMVLIK